MNLKAPVLVELWLSIRPFPWQPASLRFAYCRFPFTFWMSFWSLCWLTKTSVRYSMNVSGVIATLRGCKTGSKFIWFVINFVDLLGTSDPSRMVINWSPLQWPPTMTLLIEYQLLHQSIAKRNISSLTWATIPSESHCVVFLGRY